MPLHVPLDDAREAFREGLAAFVSAVDGLSDLDLLAASRCHGWTRLEVVSHVVAGGQEMLAGLVSPTDEPSTTDAAGFWTAFADEYADEDPVAVLMAQRRRADSYARPTSAVAQLRDVATSLDSGVAALGPGRLRSMGQVFEAGDFVATWVVENAVHQLDLHLEPAADPPASALAVVRASVETLLGSSPPGAWSDVDVALVGAGRVDPPADAGGLAERFPVLG